MLTIERRGRSMNRSLNIEMLDVMDPEERHELPRMLEAADIADFGDEARSRSSGTEKLAFSMPMPSAS